MSFFSLAKLQSATPYKAESQTSLSPETGEEGVPRLVISQEGNVLYANTGFESLNGGDKVTGRHLSELFFFNDHEGEITDGQYLVTLKDNNHEISLHFNWIKDQHHQEFLVICAEDSQPENHIAHDQAAFLELSFDACSVTNLDGIFETINENFTTMFGYGADLIGQIKLIDLIHPDHKSTFINGLQSLRQNEDIGGHISLDIPCIDASGSAKWIEWNIKKIDDRIYTTSRDLTPLKSYKDSLKRQQMKLSEAEAIGHIGQWEWVVGSEQIGFSDELYNIFGLQKKSFKPTLDSINNMIHKNDAGRMMQVFQRAIIEQNNYDMEFKITRPDGEIRFIHCEGRCETDKDDDVIALYGIMQDVTETTKREMDLRQAKDNVERAYAAKTQFLANMSHELRTPLNAIIGFSEMIERQLLGPIGTEKYLEYISGIRESGEHLLDLISDILDMSKIEAGKYELALEKFNIAKVIRMAVHMMEGRALNSNIKMNIHCDSEDTQIVADRRAVMQMVLNLLSNAVKFSRKAGQVDIYLNKGDSDIEIIVKDTGIGIPANKLANITMPFEQAECHYAREYEGTGLGLSITKELAEIHGGSLDIQSELDVGTSVTIKLPYEAKRNV